MPQAPVTPENMLDWRRWVASEPAHVIDTKTLVSLLNSPGFMDAHRTISLEDNPQECYACGDQLSEHAVASGKKGRNRKSHLDAAGNITGVASGECPEGSKGTCGGCLSHGMEDTRHALSMCPLKISAVLKVLNSSRLLGSMTHATKVAEPQRAKSQSERYEQDESSARRPRQHTGSASGLKRNREGELLDDNASSVSGANSNPQPQTSHAAKKAGKGRGRARARGTSGKGRGRSKGSGKPASASNASSSN